MKSFYILTLACLLPLFVSAQKKQSLDIVVGVTSSYRTLQPPTADTDAEEWIDFRNEEESARQQFRFGVNYNRQLSQKIWIRTGLNYSRVGYEGNVYTFFLPPTSGNQGWGDILQGNNYGDIFSIFSNTPQFDITKSTHVYDHSFLEIPISIRFETSTERFTPFLEVGVSSAFHLLTKRTYTNLQGLIVETNLDETSHLNTFHILGTAALGINYSLTDKWSLFSQLSFRHHFTPTHKEGTIEHLHNLGLEFGARMGL